ncbi:LamG-like jellyroll fold domain-containing protein [Nonomuraea lactucae]|uniref:LamG-like jellyroll fold domain-containing protein n=1 Tax=Nonomuraea lactucae TaxID=2249762 RepID=UPI0013B40E1A|nr:LamG-like jellyroll fold domain-containing protein [Nonomuraea lactucae]
MFRKEYGGTAYYDRVTINSDDSTYGTLRAGHNGEGATARSMMQFDISRVANTKVSKATLRLWHAWSAKDCGNGNYSAGAVNLYQVSPFNSGHTWNNQPGWGSLLGNDGKVVRRTGGGYQGRCPAGHQEFDVTGVVSGMANSGGTTAYFGLRAANEADIWSWKRYKIVSSAGDTQNPHLAIEYNSYPNTPDQRATASTGACVTGAERPWLGVGAPTVAARASDADNESALTLSVEWAQIQADGTYGSVLGTQSSSIPSGTSHTFTLPTLANGNYAWRARTYDGALYSKSYSGWCEFSVDTGSPNAVPVVSSPLYKDDLVNYYGGAGTTADFTFTANGVTDVAGYEYGWSDPPTTYVAAPSLGADLTKALTPPPPDADNPTRAGQLTLFVRSLDRARNKSAIRKYTFLIGSAAAPVGSWRLNEQSGTTLADSSGNGRAATPSNGAVLGRPGRLVGDTVVGFDGTDDYAGTSAPVLDTSTSFTVSSWVRMTSTAGAYQTVLSQVGTRTAAFYLQKWQNTWTFSLHPSDVDAPAAFRAQSTVAPVANVWTHLTGVYDKQNHQAKLYINGVPAATGSGSQLFKATGPLWMGQGMYGAAQTDRFAGELADVRVWNRVLAANEIAGMAATQVGWWTLDGHAYDDSGYGRDGTPAGGVTWVADRKGTPSAAGSFDGSGDIHTAGSALHTDQSYTVAAWVRITDLSLYERTVVAQEGNQVSAFYLGLRQDNNTPQWSIQMRPSDETVCCPSAAVAGPVKQGVWQHLAGVYDAGAGKLRLYVDGVKVKEVTAPTPWKATGPIAIGFGKWATGGDRWHGGLDDVRVYAGVLPDSEILTLSRA